MCYNIEKRNVICSFNIIILIFIVMIRYDLKFNKSTSFLLYLHEILNFINKYDWSNLICSTFWLLNEFILIINLFLLLYLSWFLLVNLKNISIWNKKFYIYFVGYVSWWPFILFVPSLFFTYENIFCSFF